MVEMDEYETAQAELAAMRDAETDHQYLERNGAFDDCSVIGCHSLYHHPDCPEYERPEVAAAFRAAAL